MMPFLLWIVSVLAAIHFAPGAAFSPPTSAFARNLPLHYTGSHRMPEEATTKTTAWSSLVAENFASTATDPIRRRRALNDERRREWIDKSLAYYSKVMRENRRRQIGQVQDYDTEEYRDEFLVLAKKHYFAWKKIKDGKHDHAERIYRRIIEELLQEEEEESGDGGCDHAKLAVTTLLLALHMQRMGDPKKTRAVFLDFFRAAVLNRHPDAECACSAKVLQAYALFEMKRGNGLKSLEIVQRAVKLDRTLEPVLNWKQFRDASRRRFRDASRRQSSAVVHTRGWALATKSAGNGPSNPPCC